MNLRSFLLIILFLLSGISCSRNTENSASVESKSISPISGLKAFARDGQIFLTWNEAETVTGSSFNVYVANKKIKNVTRAKIAAHHIEPHSARDWWEDPASFKKDVPPGTPVGFLIESGGQRLDPADGLFVYTIPKGLKKKLYFAVTMTDENARENRNVLLGKNSLSSGIKAFYSPVKPVWQGEGPQPEPGAGKGMPLWLNLHGKSGVIPGEYLVFGDETLGWRAGLPFKFSVKIQNGEVIIRPTDRVWINRPHNEAGDGGMPAIWTFWYGYNSNIFDRDLMSEGIPVNYTEKRLLWILNWVNEYYQTDPNRWYCSGSSMGGCGTISFGLRHPELFAALHAHVPIVSYTYLGAGSARRLEPSCWTGTIPHDLKTNEGISLLERMNSINFLANTNNDLPFLFLVNGRRDASIPWENNPPFYRAMSAAKQGFAAYWDNGEHATSGREGAPEDLKNYQNWIRRFRLNESFPAFSNTSNDNNPGNGNPDDGDLTGWINRGMDWKDIVDETNKYSITVFADFPGINYPVQTDIRLRRLQKFKPEPGQQLKVKIDENPFFFIKVTQDGSIDIPKINIPSKNGIEINIETMN